MPGDSEEETGPCRETGDRCAREVELEGIVKGLSIDALSALLLFRAARGQWRSGFDGATALDYSVFFSDRFAEVVGVEVTREVFRFVKVAEDEALRIFGEWREKKDEE
ncbi:MAG: DUF1799 domain-containing protein [Pseudomonadota bacterium]|nr:DUF1799 domain-containing protein [Pseudomonadota bacterium]